MDEDHRKSKVYRAQFSSGEAIQNELIPRFLQNLMIGIAHIGMKKNEGVVIVFSHLAALIPPLQKICPKYPKLKRQFEECRILRDEWYKMHRGIPFPTELAKKLELLYEDWWLFFNESGAGIRHQEYISRDKRLRDAILSA